MDDRSIAFRAKANSLFGKVNSFSNNPEIALI